MGAIKIIKVIDYIVDYYILSGDGTYWYGVTFISPGGQFGRRYVIPMATRHIVQNSLKVQDGVSFFFKMESARPVPFLLHDEKPTHCNQRAAPTRHN